MFSREVLDHFQNPRNAGELDKATATVEVSNPVCGDVLRLSARIENGRIAEARFLCRGCTTSIACASRLTELLSGNTSVTSTRSHCRPWSGHLANCRPKRFTGHIWPWMLRKPLQQICAAHPDFCLDSRGF